MNNKPARTHGWRSIALILATLLLTILSVVEMPILFEGTVTAQVASVTVTGVAANHSSARVYFQPVPGARDYRLYDLTAPTNVKYAGLVHLTAGPECPGSACSTHFATQSDGLTPLFPYQIVSGAAGGPQVLNVPATDIEWNSLGDGQAHTLVLEAVDQLGPVSQANLYTTNGQSGAPTVPLVNPPPAGAMLGSNKGPTNDGNLSTNGQGPYTNAPRVIARSQPFLVQPATSYAAIPSRTSATQLFYDSFENAENASLQQLSRSDTTTDAFGNLGQMSYSLNAGTPKEWAIEFRRADNVNSMPFISSDHFMDMLFDGASPDASGPSHTIYGSMAMSPKQTVDLSAGKVAHFTMEVDGHQSFRRWMSFELAPASDPLQGWDPSGFPINNSDQGLFLEFKDGGCTLDIFTGPSAAADHSPTGTAGGTQHGARLWGQAGSVGGAPIMCGWDQLYNPKTFSKNGLGLDDRSRYDFFVSQSHAAVFQDGRLLVQSDIPAGSFPWATSGPLKAYYSHYLYHSQQDQADLRSAGNPDPLCYALNAFWFNDPGHGTDACNTAYPAGYGFPYSDERHWDNMGYEVLDASDVPANDFSSLAPSVQPQAPEPPQLDTGSNGAAPASPAPATDATPEGGQETEQTIAATEPDGSKQWASITPRGVSLDFNVPATNFGLNTVVTDPKTPGTVYIGSNYQGLLKSVDHGATWTKINTGPGSELLDSGRIWALAIDPFNPTTLYAASGYGAGGPLKSTDGGVSWTHLLPTGSAVEQQIGTNDIYNVAVDPYTPNHLLASFHYFWYGTQSSGVLESKDAGSTWIVHNAPNGSGWGAGNSVWFLDNSQTWLLGSQSAGLWRTTDAGEKWGQVSTVNINHGGIYSLYRSPTTGLLYVAVWNGVLKSADDGRTWQPFMQGLPYAGYETVFGDGVSLYTAPSTATGGDNGQAHSPWYTIAESGGSSWTPYNTQTPCLANVCNGPVQMAFDGSDGSVYAVNWNAGAWRLQSGAPPLPTTTPLTASPTPTTSDANAAPTPAPADVSTAPPAGPAEPDSAAAPEGATDPDMAPDSGSGGSSGG